MVKIMRPMSNDIQKFKVAKVASLRKSLRKRRAGRFPRKHAIHQLPVFHYGDPIYEYKLYAFGILKRFFKRRFVDDALWVEDGDIRIGADADAPFVAKCGSALLQALRGH